MINGIGEAAGKIWHHLKKHGPCTFSSVVKGTKLKQRDADRAIGWLAREGKLHIERKKTGELITLTE